MELEHHVTKLVNHPVLAYCTSPATGADSSKIAMTPFTAKKCDRCCLDVMLKVFMPNLSGLKFASSTQFMGSRKLKKKSLLLLSTDRND